MSPALAGRFSTTVPPGKPLLWLLITEERKIFGFIGKRVLCHIEKFTVRKNILMEIMKFINKCANPQNASVTVHNCLLLSFH